MRANQPAPLGERKSHAENVGFLKRIRADQRTAHLAGDANQRHRIHLRVGNAGDQVRRAGAASRHGDADFSRDARIAFRREHRALLVPREDVAHAAALERVIQAA